MKVQITIFEKVLLETLNKPYSLHELSNKLDTPKKILIPIMQSLIVKDFIVSKNSIYTLNGDNIESIKECFNNTRSKYVQTMDIVGTCLKEKLNNQEEQQFQLKSVSLTDSEETLLNGMIYNLESFLKSKESPSGNTLNKKIFFWGQTDYTNLLATSSPS